MYSSYTAAIWLKVPTSCMRKYREKQVASLRSKSILDGSSSTDNQDVKSSSEDQEPSRRVDFDLAEGVHSEK
jgi:hypothetical protein